MIEVAVALGLPLRDVLALDDRDVATAVDVLRARRHG
jgi:hypothetical protein